MLVAGFIQEDVDKVLKDFSVGRDHVTHVLQVKLACWASNPYKILGIGHYNLTVTKECGRMALALVASSIRDGFDITTAHRLTVLVCYPGSILHEQLVLWCCGLRELAELPHLRRVRARVRWIPIVETMTTSHY